MDLCGKIQARCLVGPGKQGRCQRIRMKDPPLAVGKECRIGGCGQRAARVEQPIETGGCRDVLRPAKKRGCKRPVHPTSP